MARFNYAYLLIGLLFDLGAALLERQRMSQTTIGSDGGVVEQRACCTRFIKGTLLYNGTGSVV